MTAKVAAAWMPPPLGWVTRCGASERGELRGGDTRFGGCAPDGAAGGHSTLDVVEHVAQRRSQEGDGDSTGSQRRPFPGPAPGKPPGKENLSGDGERRLPIRKRIRVR